MIEEKHLKSPPLVLLDKKTHVYTAIIKPDNTYALLLEYRLDLAAVTQWAPAVNVKWPASADMAHSCDLCLSIRVCLQLCCVD